MPDDTNNKAFREKLGLVHADTVCSVLGVYPDTLKKWRGRGQGPKYLQIGKMVWYLYEDIHNWLREERDMTTQRRDYSKDKPDPALPPEPEEGPAGARDIKGRHHEDDAFNPDAVVPGREDIVPATDADDADFVEIPPDDMQVPDEAGHGRPVPPDDDPEDEHD